MCFSNDSNYTWNTMNWERRKVEGLAGSRPNYFEKVSCKSLEITAASKLSKNGGILNEVFGQTSGFFGRLIQVWCRTAILAKLHLRCLGNDWTDLNETNQDTMYITSNLKSPLNPVYYQKYTSEK